MVVVLYFFFTSLNISPGVSFDLDIDTQNTTPPMICIHRIYSTTSILFHLQPWNFEKKLKYIDL